MKYVKCDHCHETFHPGEDGGLSVTLGTVYGTQVLDFCPKHGKQLLRSLDKYTNGIILARNEEEEDIISKEESNEVG